MAKIKSFKGIQAAINTVQLIYTPEQRQGEKIVQEKVSYEVDLAELTPYEWDAATMELERPEAPAVVENGAKVKLLDDPSYLRELQEYGDNIQLLRLATSLTKAGFEDLKGMKSRE